MVCAVRKRSFDDPSLPIIQRGPTPCGEDACFWCGAHALVRRHTRRKRPAWSLDGPELSTFLCPPPPSFPLPWSYDYGHALYRAPPPSPSGTAAMREPSVVGPRGFGSTNPYCAALFHVGPCQYDAQSSTKCYLWTVPYLPREPGETHCHHGLRRPSRERHSGRVRARQPRLDG